jgi:catalase (peroxidase I)
VPGSHAGLDKARRLLWPIKQKYGRKMKVMNLDRFDVPSIAEASL